MKTFFKCETCNFSSENKETVQECEARGKAHKFTVGQTVEVKFQGTFRGGDFVEWFPGRIATLGAGHGDPSYYFVEFSPETQKKIKVFLCSVNRTWTSNDFAKFCEERRTNYLEKTIREA